MKRHVITVKPRDTLRHAREILEKERINQLPVVKDGKLVGILTDRDVRDAFPSVFVTLEEITKGATHRDPDPDRITVEEIMTPNVITVGEGVDITEVARTMRRERIGAVPVVEGERLVGILARSDLLEALIALVHSGKPAA